MNREEMARMLRKRSDCEHHYRPLTKEIEEDGHRITLNFWHCLNCGELVKTDQHLPTEIARKIT